MHNNRDVFISYHTDSSRETVERVCAALENAGISCWYAPRDVEGKYAGSITRAIRGCRTFLVMLNQFSNESEHILNEIELAFERLNKHEAIELLPFKIGEFEPGDDLAYYLKRIHMVDGIPPETEKIHQLVDRVCHMLEKKPERMLTIPERAAANDAPAQPAGTYRIIGNIVAPETQFVGRRRELEQIRTAMTGGENKLFLVGMGGIGKSEIAKMYIKQNTDHYDVILWTSFKGTLQQTIADDSAFPIQGMRHSDYPEDSVRDYFERKMRILKEISDRRVLIVMDNFDVTGDPDLEMFCGGAYSVLFTTRCHQETERFPEIVIDGMNTEEDLLALFRTKYPRELDAAGLACVRQIFSQLKGHTQSICLVGSAMQSRRISPEKMMKLLKTGVSGMTEANGKAADMIYGGLRKLFEISGLSGEERYILMNLSLIPLRGISVERFYEWCDLDDFDVIDDLIRRSWVIHNPVTDEVHLHPLVADLMAEQLARQPECCMKLIHGLLEACKVMSNTSWNSKVMLNDYAATVYERLPEGHPGRMMVLDAKALRTMGMARYMEGAEMFRVLYDHAESLEKRLEYSYRRSHSLILCGEYETGYKVAEEGRALVEGMDWKQMSRAEGYFYMAILSRISEASRYLGRYAEAIEYGRKALALTDRFYGSSPQSSCGWAEFHLGWALFLNGQLAEAEQTIRHAILLFEEIDDPWSANYSYSMLSQILANRGEYEEALALNARAYQILLTEFSEDHTDIANNLEREGNIYAAMGDTARANACYRRAEEIYTRRNCVKMAEAVRGRIR